MAEHDHNQDTTTPTEEKLAQEVKVEDIGPARKQLTIEIPESRIKEKIEAGYTQLRNDAAIPGFRRGRAPRRLIERRFGDSIRDDVKGQLLSESYTQAIQENELDVIGEPDVKEIEKIELPESGPLSFSVEVEVTPKVQLPAFDQISVKRTSGEVTESDVDEELDSYCERFGRMTPVEDAAVESDDFVVADIRVLPGKDADDDAEPITEQANGNIFVPGESREFRGHVAGIIVEDLGKRLAGKKPGDVERISMTGPAGHENEKIKDQPITIRIEIKQVQRLEPAPVEQLMEQMGIESVEELRKQARDIIEQRREQEQRADLHRQLTEQLAEKVDLELPEGLTSRQTDRVLRRRAMELAYQGVAPDKIEEQIAEMRSGSEEEARRQLKLFFIIAQAARDLEVEVAENEINGQIAMMAMRQGRRPEKLRTEMQQRGELEQLYLQLREQKTLDAILAKAQVTDAPAEEASGDEKPAKKKTTKKKTTKKKASE